MPRAPLRAAFAARLVRLLAGRIPVRVVVDGETPGAGPVLRLHRPGDFYRRIGAGGLIGLGESYQAGDWDADDLAGLLTAAATAMRSGRLGGMRKIGQWRHVPWAKALRGGRTPTAELNTVDGAKRNIERHYDLSNDLFAVFLDETMTYSSGIFAGGEPDDLAAAQRRKIDRLLDRTGVTAGRRVLEIGTGWGELSVRAARRGAHVHTITISERQLELARRRVAEAGVADRVRVELRDYRELPATDRYDAIISVEMIEAVGDRWWPAYFGAFDRLLAPGGRAGIQAITAPDDQPRSARDTYTWIQKYIFPGGVIISAAELERQVARHTGLRVTDRYAFGADYANTLRLWRERFLAGAERVAGLGFDEVFRRTWVYYLAYCEAGFRSGEIDVQQFMLSRTSG